MLGLLISQHTNTGQSFIAGQMGMGRLEICHKLVHYFNHHHIHDHQNIVDDQQNDVDDHQNDVYDDQNDVDDHHGLNEKCNKPVSAAEKG